MCRGLSNTVNKAGLITFVNTPPPPFPTYTHNVYQTTQLIAHGCYVNRCHLQTHLIIKYFIHCIEIVSSIAKNVLKMVITRYQEKSLLAPPSLHILLRLQCILAVGSGPVAAECVRSGSRSGRCNPMHG